MEHEIICSCSNLSKSYGNVQVINECNFEIHTSELVGLVGENGSGKSTFVRCLLGYTAPTKGNVLFNGSVGYCPQGNFLNHSYTVEEHFGLVSAIYRKHSTIEVDYLDHLISLFRLSGYRNRLISDLSSGTRQKVQFITSIIARPDFLIMDEPYDGFDWNMYLLFWEIAAELRTSGTAILLISHLLYDRERFTRTLELRNGKLHEYKD